MKTKGFSSGRSILSAACAVALGLAAGAAHTQTDVLALEGGDSHVEVGASGWSAQAGAIEAWWLLNNVDDKQYLLGHTTIPAFNNRIQIYNEGGGEELSLGLGDNHAMDRDIASLPVGTWNHVAVVYDDGAYEVFLNGDSVSSGTYQGLNEIGGFAHIGNNGNPDSLGEGTDGRISEVRVWNTPRTQEQIQAFMNRRLTGNESGLAGYWPLDEGAGDVVADLSGQGNDGVISDGGWATDTELEFGVVFLTDLPSAVVATQGQTVTLGPVELAAPEGGVAYQWFFNNEAIDGETGDTLVLTGVTAAQEGEYYVVVSDESDLSPFESRRVSVSVWENLPAIGLLGLALVGSLMIGAGALALRWRRRPS